MTDKAYFIEDIEIKEVQLLPEYHYVKKEHPYKTGELVNHCRWREIEKAELREIVIDNKRLYFYLDNDINKFLGLPFTIIRNLRSENERLNNNIHLLEKKIEQLKRQITKE